LGHLDALNELHIRALVLYTPHISQSSITIPHKFIANASKINIKLLPDCNARLPKEDGKSSRGAVDVLVIIACNAEKNVVDEGAYEFCFTKHLIVTNYMQPIWGVVHLNKITSSPFLTS
jgi:hypothetical protein